MSCKNQKKKHHSSGSIFKYEEFGFTGEAYYIVLTEPFYVRRFNKTIQFVMWKGGKITHLSAEAVGDSQDTEL